MGSALLDTAPLDPAFAEVSSDLPSAATQCHAAARGTASRASAEALRRQVAERLAAHRSRRPAAQSALASSLAPTPSVSVRAARIAAAVAQRYAHSPSYRAYLAAEAERATQQAKAAAQIAALNAQAVAQAQQQLLDSLNQDSLNQDSLNLEATSHEVPNHDPHPQPRIEPPAQLPRELTLWPEAEPSSAAAPRTRSTESSRSAVSRSRAHHPHSGSQAFTPALPGLTVRLFGNEAASHMLSAAHRRLSSQPTSSKSHLSRQEEDRNEAEARLLDEEIAFRKSPIFEEPAGPPIPLPANLIEFPRQLVATRKARPRYAEGPLLAAAGPAPGQSQLRIFEVDPAQISTTPVAAGASAPQWTSIWLDAPGPGSTDSAGETPSEMAHPDAGPLAGPSARSAPLPQIASIARRLNAAAIDASILLAGFLAFVAAFVIAAGRSLQVSAATTLSAADLPLDGHSALAHLSAKAAALFTTHTGLQPSLALASSALVLTLFYLLYETLFFSFSDSTPGMRCARIALCTFDDENPTRPAMRRRILAVLVSVCPLGLGLLWATLDEDRLSWHDRLTRTYQRSY
jgi:uncharacterized RDD family membrane protein YckC